MTVGNSGWTTAELAYFAGILDGEGSLSLATGTGQKNIRHNTLLFVHNTNVLLMRWIQIHFGGTLWTFAPRHATHKPTWRWELGGAAIVPVLTAVLPYLILKQEQAVLLLEYRKTLQVRGAHRPVSSEIQHQRIEMKTRLSILNRRGIISEGVAS